LMEDKSDLILLRVEEKPTSQEETVTNITHKLNTMRKPKKRLSMIQTLFKRLKKCKRELKSKPSKNNRWKLMKKFMKNNRQPKAVMGKLQLKMLKMINDYYER